MQILQAKMKDGLLTTGFILVLVSLFFFSIPILFHTDSDNYFGLFICNYFISVGYLVAIIGHGKSKVDEHKIHYTFFNLILYLISAYSLNRELVVFNASPGWLCVLLVVVCANYILSIFFEYLPQWIRLVILFLLGVSIVLFIYLAIYLMPLYIFSVPALIVLGISIHTFVPALMTIYTFLLANKLAGDKTKYWVSFSSGASLAVMVAIVFTIVWKINLKDINQAYAKAVSEGNNDMPAWIQVAQGVENNSIIEKILKTDLVYVAPRLNMESSIFWNSPDRSFGEEQKIHDPLVVFASAFSGNIYINDEDRIKILKSQFNGRHQVEERLWTGRDLRTLHVNSIVTIWPDMHLGYTEKVITVFNHSPNRGWNRDEEAIYTFHLPEGGVVTSLSLWINGREEKGILTTKEKADTAYKSIVGVSKPRDPSVVHWQEGNMVSVRVFPVASNNNRIFKIGITAPLRKENDKLFYDNIWFDGPDASAAKENVKINLSGPVKNIVQQASFEQDNKNTLIRSGNYRSQWSFCLNDEGLANKSFSFNNNRYFLKSYQPQRAPVDIQQVYLDINASWSASEFETVWNAIKNKKVWAYGDDLIPLNEENHEQVFHSLKKTQFSLFPLFQITDPAHSLLISKTGTTSPNLSDLQGSNFFNNLKSFSSKQERLKLFNIGQKLSPYLSSLKEYRFFQYESGSVQELQHLLASRQFVRDQENEKEVVVHNAGLSIVKEEGTLPSNAPDHLMRLFAYNHIMQQIEQVGLSGILENDQLVETAKEAYVVSPLSSLIVLETQQDYERFGIEDSKASLKNATIKSNGAVPEPHEWLLIMISAVIAIYLMMKSRF
jgi:XrtN system VIT domain protein